MPTGLPPRRANYKTSPGIQVGLLVIVAAALLDVFDLWGRFFDPGALIHTACSLVPLTAPIQLITFESVIGFVHTKCQSGVTNPEPLASVIFYMLKMSVAIWVLPIYWIWTAISREEFNIARSRQFSKFEKPNGLRDFLKIAMIAIAGLGAVCIGGFVELSYQTMNGTVGPTLFGPQKPMEDVAAGMFYAFLIFITFTPLLLLDFFFTHRSSRDGS